MLFAQFMKFLRQPGYRKVSLAFQIRTRRTCVTARFSAWRSSGNQLGAECVSEKKRADLRGGLDVEETFVLFAIFCVDAGCRGAHRQMVGQLQYHDDRRTDEGRYGLHGFEGKGRRGHGYGGACCGKAVVASEREAGWPKVTFEVPTDDGGLLIFDLTFDGTAIQGTCAGTGSGGEKMSAKLNLRRTT